MERDNPIQTLSDDKFGFSEIAEKLAVSIRRNIKGDGLVVGVEGAWGSGKTSLLNLVAEQLRQNSGGEPPVIVRFEPWIVSNRDAMMESLFEEVLVCLRDVKASRAGPVAGLPEYANNFALRVQRTAKLLQNYSRHLKIAGKLIPGVGGAIEIGQAVVDYMADGPAKLSLVEQKRELCSAIKDLDCGIVVIVDDLDRLEPTECIEILRLVRAVADFPNVTYLIGYDQHTVANSIQTALNVPNGRAYLEKLFQAIFAVPKIDRFDLHGMLRERIAGYVSRKDQYSVGENGIDDERLLEVISTEGEVRLSTPRDVVRLVNNLSLYVEPIAEKLDLADAVWLHMNFSKNPNLFRWIERYCRFMWHDISGDLKPEDYEKQQLVDELHRHLNSDGPVLGNRKFLWQRILPTISFGLDDKKSPQDIELFGYLSAKQKSELATAKRLSSPEVGPLYFQYVEPTGTLSDSEYSQLTTDLEGNAEACRLMLSNLLARTRKQGGLIADLFLERLVNDRRVVLSSAHKGLVFAFCDLADAFKTGGKKIDPHRPTSWSHCHKILRDVARSLPPTDQQAFVGALFEGGNALEYLTALLRRETFAHGHYVTEKKPEEEWVLNDDSYRLAHSKLAKRYSCMSLKELLDYRDPLNILYAWKQAGYDVEARAWISSRTITDDDFLDLLKAMRTESHSSDGTELVLQWKYVSDFFDIEAAKQRLSDIVSGTATSTVLIQKAKKVQDALASGRDW